MKTIENFVDRWLVSPLNSFLSSRTGLVLALVFPIIVIPMSNAVKQVENILSSNWIQLWALFVLGIITARTQKHVHKIHKHLGIK